MRPFKGWIVVDHKGKPVNTIVFSSKKTAKEWAGWSDWKTVRVVVQEAKR